MGNFSSLTTTATLHSFWPTTSRPCSSSFESIWKRREICSQANGPQLLRRTPRENWSGPHRLRETEWLCATWKMSRYDIHIFLSCHMRMWHYLKLSKWIISERPLRPRFEIRQNALSDSTWHRLCWRILWPQKQIGDVPHVWIIYDANGHLSGRFFQS